jgi:ATP-dependent Lon protease
MRFVYAKTIEEALEAAFGNGKLNWRRGDLLIESRL